MIGLLQQLEYLYGFYFKRAEAVMGAVYIVGGAAAAYRRTVIQELGGFDERILTEDIELSTRLQHRGYRVGYAADAVVYTEGPSDLVGLCRQRLRWKHGRLVTFLRYRRLFGSLSAHHSRYLSLLVLPAALYGEMLLLLWPALLPLCLAYSIIVRDLMLLTAFITAMTLLVWMQIAIDPQRRRHRNLVPLAPVAWLMFCWLDLIECQALVRSLARLATGRSVRWQRWQRRGVFDGSSPPLAVGAR
jgi:cellulose synthase/poly-beta-1,6-N-acetylglucosamine synthase-like glycosyltransferase